MAVEYTGIVGGCAVIPVNVVANRCAAGAIIGLWKACDVRTRCAVSPLSASTCPAWRTAAAGPLTTVWSGALTAAMTAPSGSSAATWSAGARTASISPAGIAAIAAPRAATSFAASGSANTSDTAAATNSPMLCPSNTVGWMPQDIHIFASAYSTANSTGWATSVGSRSASAPVCQDRRTSAPAAASRSRHSSNAAVNAGSAPCSPRAIAACWEPCPGNRNATGRRRPGVPVPMIRSGCPVSAASACSALSATTAARTSCAVRPSCSTPTVAANACSPCPDRCLVSAARYARSAASVRPDQTTSRGRVGAGGAGSGSGASCSTACTLVPPNPSELMPARRGRSGVRGQARPSVTSVNGEPAQSSFGFGSVTCRVGTSCSRCRHNAVLISAATPAACPRWPTLLLTEPSPQYPVGRVRPPASRRYASLSAANSIRSPIGVPVPCASR